MNHGPFFMVSTRRWWRLTLEMMSVFFNSFRVGGIVVVSPSRDSV
jgi:hypothetical protein